MVNDIKRSRTTVSMYLRALRTIIIVCIFLYIISICYMRSAGSSRIEAFVLGAPNAVERADFGHEFLPERPA